MGIATLAVCPGSTRGSVRTRKRARAKAKASKENIASVVRRVTLQESARRAKMEKSLKDKEMVTKEKAKVRGSGARASGM